MANKIDLVGVKFGRLTVVNDTGKRNKSKRVIYLCKCDCGNVVEVDRLNLRNGSTKSCGCLKKESNTKHNSSHSRLYRIWAGMIQRCENEKNCNYNYYGARGIKVCREWHEFESFMRWAIINGYKKGLSIDRENVNGDYEPSNCRWATREQQDNNRRDNVFVEVRGETLTLAQTARKYNLSIGMIHHRYYVGDRGEKLIEPSKRGVKRNGEINRQKFIKMNESNVSEVKWLLNHTKMYQSEIASIFGIAQTMVSKIKLGQFHAEIKEKMPDWWGKSEKKA